MAEFNSMDITSANAIAVLIVQKLYPNGHQLQNFSADSAIVADSIQIAETRMGVDGHMAAGVTPNIHQVTIQLEANSPSRYVFKHLHESMAQNLELYELSLTIKIKATGETYQYSKGCLQSISPLPSLNKVLAPITAVLHFEKLESI